METAVKRTIFVALMSLRKVYLHCSVALRRKLLQFPHGAVDYAKTAKVREAMWKQ